MKFEEIPLIVPSLDELSKKYGALIEKLENAKTAEEQINAYKKIMKYDDHVATIFTVISIRYSLDTTNEEYVKANDVLDEIAPQVQVFSDRINKILDNDSKNNLMKYLKIYFMFINNIRVYKL